VDDTPILDAQWPPGLDPATLPFRTRTATVLRRRGYFDDPSPFDALVEIDVMGWASAGSLVRGSTGFKFPTA
jgi:hypothetical protein